MILLPTPVPSPSIPSHTPPSDSIHFVPSVIYWLFLQMYPLYAIRRPTLDLDGGEGTMGTKVEILKWNMDVTPK